LFSEVTTNLLCSIIVAEVANLTACANPVLIKISEKNRIFINLEPMTG